MNSTLSLSIAVAALSLLSLFLLLFIWSAKRHQDPKLRIESDWPIDSLLPSLAGLCLSVPVDGNDIEIYENGAFFDALLGEIPSARFSVHFETFLWKEGVLGERLANALSERARAGVQVRVLLDANGCKGIGKAAEQQMLAAGCKVVKFHPPGLRNIGVMNERDHRKLVVLDGRRAFVGGHCIVDSWLGDAQDSEHFGDVSIGIRGPIVTAVQSAFSENWAGETGELFVGDDVFPRLERAGDITVHAAFLKPEGSAPAVKILHHTVICLARKRIRIQNPYLIPDAEAITALGAAVRRGVDVRVMVPSVGGSDNALVQHASHRNFEEMLRLGIRIFEYPHTLLHQKVMSVDGTWCAIGSSNFDDRSFEINDEISLSMISPETVARLEAIFDKYVPECREIDLEQWRRRGLRHRLIDNACYTINELL